MRKKRVSPQQEAEDYIKLKADKTGLEQQFINSFKGLFALVLVDCLFVFC